MAEPVASLVPRMEGDRRRIERVVALHATSRYRERAARLLARLLVESGASGVAYGWTDGLAPALLSPVHLVTARADVRWDLTLPRTHVETIDRDSPYEWKLVLRDVSPERMERVDSTIAYVKGFFAEAADRDVPEIGDRGLEEPRPFLQLLDAFRFCAFTVAQKSAEVIRGAFHREIAGLPEGARREAERVAETLEKADRLQPALLDLGSALDRAGAFSDAAGVHLIGYELAVLRCDGIAGIDAARSAGRAFRRMADLGSSIRWYRLAARIARLEEEWGRLALALDGAGNTHRHGGSFPRARKAYEEAWSYAVLSKDPTAIGNVAHSMMIVEREAGRLEAAASYGWTSLASHSDPDARAMLLLDLGTLLRDGGDIESAERAYGLAYRGTRERSVRLMAADALAFCAALQRDHAGYARRRAAVREIELREPFIRVQLGYFRGLSLAALGEVDRARRVLRAVERYARSWKLAEWEVKAAETQLPLPQSSPMDTPAEVRQGLRRLEVAAT